MAAAIGYMIPKRAEMAVCCIMTYMVTRSSPISKQDKIQQFFIRGIRIEEMLTYIRIWKQRLVDVDKRERRAKGTHSQAGLDERTSGTIELYLVDGKSQITLQNLSRR